MTSSSSARRAPLPLQLGHVVRVDRGDARREDPVHGSRIGRLTDAEEGSALVGAGRLSSPRPRSAPARERRRRPSWTAPSWRRPSWRCLLGRVFFAPSSSGGADAGVRHVVQRVERLQCGRQRRGGRGLQGDLAGRNLLPRRLPRGVACPGRGLAGASGTAGCAPVARHLRAARRARGADRCATAQRARATSYVRPPTASGSDAVRAGKVRIPVTVLRVFTRLSVRRGASPVPRRRRPRPWRTPRAGRTKARPESGSGPVAWCSGLRLERTSSTPDWPSDFTRWALSVAVSLTSWAAWVAVSLTSCATSWATDFAWSTTGWPCSFAASTT